MLPPRAFAAVVVVVIVVGAAVSTSSCASIGQQCAASFLQVAAQACVDFICDDPGDLDADSDIAPAPGPRDESDAEVAPPAWQPREGNCDVVEEGETTRIACPDGTRAVFAGAAARHLELEEERAADRSADKDAPCTAARVVVQGVDVDGDGALSPTETTGRIYECPDKDGVRAPTLVGHLTIFGADDVARLAGRRAITGGVIVKSASLVELSLPQLQSIGGTLRVDAAPALESIALAHLAAVGGDVVVERAPRLARVDVRTLRRVGGGVVVVDNPKLAQSSVESIVFHLSEHGWAGPVDVGGNLAK